MLYLMDIDGTLIRSYMREGAPPEAYELVTVLPGRLEKLRQLRAAGDRVALVTNQGGVAMGYQTFEETRAKMLEVLDALEFPASKMVPLRLAADGQMRGAALVYAAVHHPKARVREWLCSEESDWRKPGGGMILRAMADYEVTVEETVFVGDLPSDAAAADAAGVSYVDALVFFA